jgi:hypothetical protein
MARPHRYAKRCGREFWSTGVLHIATADFSSASELHPASAGLEVLSGRCWCCSPRAKALGYSVRPFHDHEVTSAIKALHLKMALF